MVQDNAKKHPGNITINTRTLLKVAKFNRGNEGHAHLTESNNTTKWRVKFFLVHDAFVTQRQRKY